MTDIAEQVREQAAKVADQLSRDERQLEQDLVSRGNTYGALIVRRSAVAYETIAAAIRAMPLPAPPEDAL